MLRRRLLKKYGFLILIVLTISVLHLEAQAFPKAVGYVNDFAGILPRGDKQQLTELIDLLEKVTSAEIAVVTIDSFEPYRSIEEYSFDLANTWGVGKEGLNNGILMVIAMKERRVRIELGLGMERLFSDSETGLIMDKHMIPYFRDGDYGKGFLETTKVVAGVILKDYLEN
ncbi:MAG: TPM domain-containing protein [Spirochaetales bacterium]|nr:TPM domain-containing protein [Spirochaetales bacterium]